MAETGIVDIRGKQYKTVALRVSEFRKDYTPDKGWAISTSIIHRDEEWVVMRAEIGINNVPIAVGHAEERRSSGQINKTSALENCETSAIGRALAAFGLGGSEYASANEVQNAIHQQSAPAGPTGREAFWNAMKEWTGMSDKDDLLAACKQFSSHLGISPEDGAKMSDPQCRVLASAVLALIEKKENFAIYMVKSKETPDVK